MSLILVRRLPVTESPVTTQALWRAVFRVNAMPHDSRRRDGESAFECRSFVLMVFNGLC